MNNSVPVEWLMGASDHAIQNFVMTRLNQAANLRKEIIAMEDELRSLNQAAEVGQWLIDHREELLRTVGSHLESAKVSSISDAA